MILSNILIFIHFCFNSCLLTCSYLHMESSLPHLLMSIQQLSSLSSMVTQRRKIALTFDNPN